MLAVFLFYVVLVAYTALESLLVKPDLILSGPESHEVLRHIRYLNSQIMMIKNSVKQIIP